MAEVWLLCGKPGSGKTTHAKKLAIEYDLEHFSADEWMLHFFDEHMSREEFDAKLFLCQDMIYREAERFLQRGIGVVFDFGFWKRAQRNSIKARFAAGGHTTRLIWLKIPDNEILRRLEERNQKLDKATFHVTPEMFYELAAFFEEPTIDEQVEVVE